MIRYLKRNQLDIKKYDACISIAVQSKVYAFSWYLDCVLENWDTLVLDDYAAVMPLPKAKKYGIAYIFQPFWIQHLGLFSKRSLSDAQNADFIKNMPKKFRLIDFNINFKFQNAEERLNYILPLGNDYKTFFKNFSKLRKRTISKAIKSKIFIKELDEWDSLLNFHRNQKSPHFKISTTAFSKLDQLLSNLNKLNKIIILAAYSKDNQLLGGAIFILSNNRITYLYSIVNKHGRDLQAMSLIINSIIQKHSESSFILDFEGSMLPGVAKFIKSFGAQKELYYHYKKWRLF